MDSTLNWEAEQRLLRIEDKLGLTWPPDDLANGEETEEGEDTEPEEVEPDEELE